eukprot:XP_001698100.1 predicted protein [Chlamydomonas reinhardtii]
MPTDFAAQDGHVHLLWVQSGHKLSPIAAQAAALPPDPDVVLDEFVSAFGLPRQKLLMILQRQPALARAHPRLLAERIAAYTRVTGLSAYQLLYVVARRPAVLQLPPPVLGARLEALSEGLSLSREDALKMLLSQPAFVDVPPDALRLLVIRVAGELRVRPPAALRVLAGLPPGELRGILVRPPGMLRERLAGLRRLMKQTFGSRRATPRAALLLVARCPLLLALPNKAPRLLLVDPARVRSRLEGLTFSLMVPRKTALDMVVRQPQLLVYQTETLAENWAALQGLLGVTFEAAMAVVARHPNLLCIGPATLSSKLAALEALFALPHARAVLLCLERPVLLTYSERRYKLIHRTLSSLIPLTPAALGRLVLSHSYLLQEDPMQLTSKASDAASLLALTEADIGNMLGRSPAFITRDFRHWQTNLDTITSSLGVRLEHARAAVFRYPGLLAADPAELHRSAASLMCLVRTSPAWLSQLEAVTQPDVVFRCLRGHNPRTLAHLRFLVDAGLQKKQSFISPIIWDRPTFTQRYPAFEVQAGAAEAWLVAEPAGPAPQAEGTVDARGLGQGWDEEGGERWDSSGASGRSAAGTSTSAAAPKATSGSAGSPATSTSAAVTSSSAAGAAAPKPEGAQPGAGASLPPASNALTTGAGWTIADYHGRSEKRLDSNVFRAGAALWQLILYPNGDEGHKGYISLYIGATLAPHWGPKEGVLCSWRFTIINMRGKRPHVVQEAQHNFTQYRTNWGFNKLVLRTALLDSGEGWLDAQGALLLRVDVVPHWAEYAGVERQHFDTVRSSAALAAELAARGVSDLALSLAISEDGRSSVGYTLRGRVYHSAAELRAALAASSEPLRAFFASSAAAATLGDPVWPLVMDGSNASGRKAQGQARPCKARYEGCAAALGLGPEAPLSLALYGDDSSRGASGNMAAFGAAVGDDDDDDEEADGSIPAWLGLGPRPLREEPRCQLCLRNAPECGFVHADSICVAACFGCAQQLAAPAGGAAAAAPLCCPFCSKAIISVLAVHAVAQ